jgi:BASS family bile acid:Na+ symporter
MPGTAMRLIVAQAPLVMISGVVLGLSLPDLAHVMRPWVVPISITMVLLSFLRIDPARLGQAFRAPGHLLAVSAAILLGMPLVTALAAWATGAPGWLVTGLALAAAAPPLSSAAAFALLLRIDAAEVTAISIPATFLSPLTVWLVTSLGPGLGTGVDASGLALRLGVIIGAAFLIAYAIRRLAGKSRVERAAPSLDSAILILMVLIGIGVMDDINLALRADPRGWLLILLAAWAVLLASCLLVGLAFRHSGRDKAMAAAVARGFRNMALMVAAVSGTVGPEVLLVVITAQLPLFFSPVLLRPILFRIGRG